MADLRMLLLVLVAIAGLGCQDAAPAGRAGWPKTLRFLISISQENPDVEASRLRPIGDYLARELGIPVQVIGSSGYGVAIEALRARKIEACLSGSFAYLIAAERTGAEVIAMRSNEDGTSGYSGGLAVAAASPIRTVEDLKARARELTLSFVDPASASGHLVQRAFLTSIGLGPEKSFKKVTFTQDHSISAMTLLGGKVDVAAVGETILPALEANGKLPKEALRFVWISPRIPEGPVVVRKDLPGDLKLALRDALLAIHEKAPEAYYNMTAKVYRERFKQKRFIAAQEADFAGLRDLARSLPALQLVEP